VVIDHAQFGRLLMVDGALRSSSADEFVYHEMMSHVPLLAHGGAGRVLIVGGADLGLAEEVLRHRSVRKLVQVEADQLTLKLARSHLGAVNAPVFSDTRFELRTVDGARFLATTEERFDVVLVDLPEPAGTAMPTLTREFFRHARGCLNPGGLLATRLGAPFCSHSNSRRRSSGWPRCSRWCLPTSCRSPACWADPSPSPGPAIR
jgi:spermidine synthase